MPRLDELDLFISPVERAEHAVNAISRISEHSAHAPGMQSRDDEVTNGLGHEITFELARTSK
jgi:hypothetical protein